jgi:hypothetical protein
LGEGHDRLGFIATLLWRPLSRGSLGAIKAEFGEGWTQFVQGVEGGARGAEDHALAGGGVEHPRGDRDPARVRCATHEDDLPGPADLAVEDLGACAERRVPSVVDARRKCGMGKMKLVC